MLSSSIVRNWNSVVRSTFFERGGAAIGARATMVGRVRFFGPLVACLVIDPPGPGCEFSTQGQFSMGSEVVDEPVRFELVGFGGVAENAQYDTALGRTATLAILPRGTRR